MTSFRCLLAFLSCLACLPAQDLNKARTAFQKAGRSEVAAERRAGIDAMVATADARAMKDFLAAISDSQKDVDMWDARIARTGAEIAKAWESVDKQSGAGRPVSAGSANAAASKHIEISKQLAELTAKQQSVLAWQRELLLGASRLLGALPIADRDPWIATLAKDAGRAKGDARRQLVEILGGIEGSAARNALGELLLRGPDAGTRVAAADALGDLEAADSLDVLGQAARDDESWSVRVAAVTALGRLPDTRAVGVLIEVLEKGSGRLIDDVVAALEDQSGQSFSDNAPLWRDWYEKEGEPLGKKCRELTEAPAPDQARTIAQIGDSKFLCGARTLLSLLGVGRNATKATLPAELAESAREAVGRALAGVKKRPVRERNLERLLLAPLRAEKVATQQQALLLIVGRVSTKNALATLLRFANDSDATTSAIAVRGLSHQSEPSGEGAAAEPPLILPLLSDFVTHPRKDATIKLAAVEALSAQAGYARTATSSVEALIRALSDNPTDVVQSAQSALEKITGQSLGPTYPAWRDWWQNHRATFRPTREVAREEPETPEKQEKATTSFYGIETRSKHLLFILDRSGSMSQNDAGGGKTRFEVAKTELIQAVSALPEDATFNIIFYNHEYSVWKKKMEKATAGNKKAAVAWIEAVEPVGATNIFDPLEHGFGLAGRGTHDSAYGVTVDTIFFLSDGQPNRGRIIEPEQILSEVARMNDLQKVRVHSIGIGGGGGAASMDNGHNAAFMRRLAEMSGGTYIAR